MEGEAPRRVGKYRLIAELARGGMADVSLAIASGMAGFNKLVVIKQLRASLADDEDFLAMFLEEARLAARLNHPNLVQTNEVGSEGRRPFIAMEFLDGQPLHRIESRLRNVADFDLPMKLRILADVCAGLHYAHELTDFDGSPLGVVHRDVSPHNVFVTYEGQVKVVDFGIAKMRDSTVETRAGQLKGKISYMPPEQARSERVDRRADIYAVGMMLWEIVVGRRMWSGVPDIAIMDHLRAGQIQSLRQALPSVHEEVARICDRALSLDAADRHPTAQLLREELEAAATLVGPKVDARALGACVAAAFTEHRERVRRTIEAGIDQTAVGPNQSQEIARLMTALPGLEMPTPTTDPSSPSAKKRVQSAPGADVASGSLAIRPTQSATEPPPRTERAPRNVSSWVATSAMGLLVVAGSLGLARTLLFGGKSDPPPAVDPKSKTSFVATPPIPPTNAGCESTNKPLVELSGDIDSDATLGCENDYLLRFTTFVHAGATLTIRPGTTLEGDGATKGTLVVQPGGRLVADGTRDRPIVFTSQRPVADRLPGDWGGVLLLGRASINLRDEAGNPVSGRVEGITKGGEYGGHDDDDDSGILRYVRIEYSGIAIGPNNEINGLTLAGVGRKTIIDHVDIRHTADDCFEFFGGTAQAKHLVCQGNGDDGFDWDYGFTGKLQFLYLQQDPEAPDGANGLEGDNDPDATQNMPISAPTIFNATLCGKGRKGSKKQFGMLLKGGTHGRIANVIVDGFDTMVEMRDETTHVDLTGSILFGGAPPDPILLTKPLHNVVIDPGLPACFDAEQPRMLPEHALTETASAPPDDGFFDPYARYVGAFRDDKDDWATGAWIGWGRR